VGTTARFGVWYVSPCPLSDIAGACTHFKYSYLDATDTEHWRNSHVDGAFLIYINKSRLTGWDEGWTNTQKTDAFKTWLTTQATAGNPVVIAHQVITPIALTPISVPLSALPQLDSITPRQNVITVSNATSAELTYQKSPARQADEIAAAIALLP